MAEQKNNEQSAGVAVATKTDKSNPTNAMAKTELTHSERFTQMVIREYSGAAGTAIDVPERQKRLIQNYFIAVDMALKSAEDKRLKKSETYRDKVQVSWANVNMEQLAINVVACSRIGFDPVLPNHINMVPYKNNTTGKYDIGFLEGYRGKELKAKKYGFDVPDNVIVELVFANDHFKPLKKDLTHEIESYEFRVADDAFNRGEVAGGFYYHEYYSEPKKNVLKFFTRADIEKRKPEYASAEFWGGEKDEYKDNKKTGNKIKVEGWYEEMCWKTLYRAAYGSITIDSEKIDDNLMRVLAIERENEERVLPDTLHDNIHAKVEEKTGTKKVGIEDAQFEEINRSPSAPGAETDNAQQQEPAEQGASSGPKF